MARLQQGAIVWADLPEPAGRRPVVVLTRDSAISRLNAVTVGPVTRTIRGIPTEVLLTPADGVPTICAVSLDNVFTTPRNMLGKAITMLDRSKITEVFAAIRYAFDMPA